MSKQAIWNIEPHTLAKHELLRKYLNAWFPILTAQGYNRRIIFLDGFAGPGIYADEEPGSPLIAIQALVGHPYFANLSEIEFVFVFVEKETERFKSLEREIEKFWRRYEGGQPENIRIYMYNDEFNKVVQQIMTQTGGHIAPTLAFIDPFGWSGIPMTVIRDLLSSDKCELLVNFMYDSVNRFVTDKRSSIARNFAELFGTKEEEYTAVAELDREKRKKFLHGLYISQLKKVVGFRFVKSFEMVDRDRGRTVYFLIFGTKSIKGLEVMKDVMWSLDPVEGARFAGFKENQQVLFELEPDLEPLKRILLDQFGGKTVYIEEIEQFVIQETIYKRSHYKGQLKYLEYNGFIECKSARSRRGTYPPQTCLYFTRGSA